MAIDYSEFTEVVRVGVKANKKHDKFLLQLTHEGKRKRKIFTVTQAAWSKKERKEKAADVYKDFRDIILREGLFTPDTKLDVVMKKYFEEEAGGSKTYNASRIKGYENYIQPDLGKKAVDKITLSMMNKIKTSMSKQGKTDQTKNGCKPKTINEVLVNTLIPILQYAKDNDAIEKIPPFKKLPISKSNKKPKNAKVMIADLYKAIMTRYKDDAYFRSMFLFALYGRRFNEIATLHTNDIDYANERYTIRAGNSKIDQDITFTLPQPLIEALQELQPDRGLVFYKGKEKIWTPRKQVFKLREDTGIEQLTMHYFRHIMATALLELGENVITAAASLGHSNTNTTEQFYAQIRNEASTKKAVEVIAEVLEQ